MKTIKTILFAVAITGSLILQSCNKDDDSSNDDSANDNSNCIVLINQPAQGNFRGASFISPEAFYKALPGENNGYTGSIYIKENLDDDCFFPTFDGTQDSILFPLASLETQTITLSETGSNTLNFNRIVDGTTEIELAVCGTIEITSYDVTAGEVKGTVFAKGQEGSEVNGNFTLLLCEF